MSVNSFEVIALPTGTFTFPLDGDYPGQTGVVVAYAIRHADGVFLFDTGFAPDGPDMDEFYVRWQVRPRDMDEVLTEAGVERAEVTAIANCHQPGARTAFGILSGGEVSEWLMVPLSKSGVRKHRGFESRPLRHTRSFGPVGMPGRS